MLKKVDPNSLTLEERIVATNKCQKTHKGGRTLSWNVLVVVGDRRGYVGAGIGKARAIPDAIRKGVEAAKKNIIQIPLVGNTIPHEILARHGAAEVLLKPAAPGTGIVAGSAVRVIMDLGGVHDVLGKSLGSANAINITWATFEAIKNLKRASEVAELRGKTVDEMVPWMKKAEENVHAGAGSYNA